MVAVLYFTSLDSLTYCFGFSVPSTSASAPPPSNPHIFSFQIWILCQNSLTRELKIRVVGFILKKLFKHFEMLIVSHALHCVMVTILYSISFDSLLYYCGLNVR